MTKILSIVWYKVLPPVFGGQKGIAGFNKHLAKHHPLVCLCSKNNEPTDDLFYKALPELSVSKLQFINPFVWLKIRAIAKKEHPTHIICEHPYHGIAAVLAARTTNAKVIVHSHNIESERFRQAGKFWWKMLRIYERWVHRNADLNLFKTQRDKEFAIHQFGLQHQKCVCVPYGIVKPVLNDDANKLIRQRHAIAENEHILLFAGTLDYSPNATAVKDIYSKLLPELKKTGLQFKIIICGRNHDPRFFYLNQLSDPLIINTGEVSDIENYFQAADVFINTVSSGGGVQTKNFEAIANNCSVVCFEAMSEGLPLFLIGTKLQLVSDNNWKDFAKNISTLLQKIEPTPNAFFTYFGWAASISTLNERLKTL